MSDYELTTTDAGRVLPIIPGRGDHEYKGGLFDKVFDSPGGAGRNYYATSLGPQVLLVTLNSRYASLKPQSGRVQAAFLKQTLEQNAAVRWQVAKYHMPIYPAAKHAIPASKKAWAPLFEQYNLDLACEADGHCIKRTLALRGDKEDPTGVTYIGEGGGGRLSACPGPTPRTWPKPAPEITSSCSISAPRR